MRVRVVIFAVFGLLSTGLGLAILFLPELALSTQTVELVIRLFAQADQTRPIVFVALGIVFYIVVSSVSIGGAAYSQDSTVADKYSDAIENRPESVTANKRMVTACELDDELTTAAAEGGHKFKSVRETLVETAVSVRTTATNRDEGRSRADIQRGEWTDDQLAAAFLSGEAGPTPSLFSRFRLWLVPTHERRRRIERSLSAIEEMQL